MPELPEVEAVRRQLEPVMVGARITRVELRRPDLRAPFPRRFAQRMQGATTLALTVAAAGALAAAGTGAHLAGGALDVLRNVAGMTGIGLLCAAALGGGLAWIGPVGYLVAGAYALYTQWHGPVLATPWLWPARPPHDPGAAICAGVVFAAGLAVITVRGARDPAGE